jgi:hypothetical protein
MLYSVYNCRKQEVRIVIVVLKRKENQMPERWTYFFDNEGNELGSEEGLLPITLYKGMQMTIHSYDDIFEVIDWQFHKGHSEEKPGLRIYLKPLKRK